MLKDIIFFGSFAKGKAAPRDIDIALLVADKDEDMVGEAEKEISSKLAGKADFTVFALNDMYTRVWFSVMTEGYSVLRDSWLSDVYGISPSKLYKYSLKSLRAVQKVQFARGLKNVLAETSGTFLTRTVVLVPLHKSEHFEEFLQAWKIEFEAQRYGLMQEYAVAQR